MPFFRATAHFSVRPACSVQHGGWAQTDEAYQPRHIRATHDAPSAPLFSKRRDPVPSIAMLIVLVVVHREDSANPQAAGLSSLD
jgi:hypothetical protein